MATSEDRSRVAAIQDRIIELAVQQDEAEKQRDQGRAAELKDEIARLAAECDRLRGAG